MERANYVLGAAAGLWLLGMLVQGALLLRQLVRTRRLVARSQPVEGDAAELFDDLVARLDVARAAARGCASPPRSPRRRSPV